MKATRKLARSVGEVVAQRAVDNAGAVVDGGGRWPRLLGGLETHILQQGRFGEVALGNVGFVMHAFPPAEEVQQIMRIDAQTGIGQAADVFAVQLTVDPADLAARGLFDKADRTLSGVGCAPVDHLEGHR